MTSEESFALGRFGPAALGMALGPTTDDLLVTIEGVGVLQYEVSSKRNTCSWNSSPALGSFICPAVFNTSSKKYYAACKSSPSKQELLSWSSDSSGEALDKSSQRIQLPKPVFSIHPTSCTPRVVDESEEQSTTKAPQQQASTSGRSEKEGVFIVFTDGEVAIDGFYHNGKRNAALGLQGRVLATSSHRGKLVVASTDDAGTCVIAMYSLAGGIPAQEMKACIDIPQKAALLSLSVRGQALSILWSCGLLQMFNLFPGTNNTHSLRPQCSRRLAGFEVEGRAAKIPKNGKRHGTKRKSGALEEHVCPCQAAIVTAPGSLVAMLSWKGEESAGWSRLNLTVMDAMYGSVRRVDELQATSTTPSKYSYLQALHLGSDSQQVAILASGTVIVTPLEDAPPTLATLVGSLALSQSNRQSKAARRAFHREEWPGLQPFPTTHGRPSWLPTTSQDCNIGDSLGQIAVPIDIREADASEALDTSISELSAAICLTRTFESLESATRLLDGLLDRVATEWTENVRSSHTALPADLLALLYLRLSEKGYWELFARLLKTLPLKSLSYCEAILPQLVQGNQFSLLVKVIAQVRSLPGKGLVDAVQQLLGSSGPSRAKALKSWQETQKSEGAEPFSFSPEEQVLHHLVAADVHSESLVQALKALPVVSAKQLIAYLLKWFRSYAEGFQNKAASGLVVPSWKSIIAWCERLIDALFNTLVTSPECSQLMKELGEAVVAQTQQSSALLPLLSIVKQIRQKAPMPQRSTANSSYIVELLDISVNA